jgi:hypothetical protein
MRDERITGRCTLTENKPIIYPIIVNDDEFAKLKKLMYKECLVHRPGRPTNNQYINLLNNIVRCKECGSNLTLNSREVCFIGKVRTYHCKNSGNGICPHSSIRVDRLESIVKIIIAGSSLIDDLILAKKEQNNEPDNSNYYLAEIVNIKKQRDNLYNLIALRGTNDELINKLNSFERKEKQLNQDLERERLKQNISNTLIEAKEYITSDEKWLIPEYRLQIKLLLKELIEYIKIDLKSGHQNLRYLTIKLFDVSEPISCIISKNICWVGKQQYHYTGIELTLQEKEMYGRMRARSTRQQEYVRAGVAKRAI